MMVSWTKLIRGAVLGSAILLFPLLLTPAVFAQRGNQERDLTPSRANPQFLAVFRDVTAKSCKSTVRVLCDDKEAALGTIVGEDGWILTKASLLTGKVTIKLMDGKTINATVIGIQEKFDLAMLKVEATNLPAVKFKESKATPVGSWVVSVGPSETPVAIGVLSVATRTPPPAPGNRTNPPPSNTTNTSYLGIGVSKDGVTAKIERVSPESPAEKAGLKVADKILSIHGKAVTDQESVIAALAPLKPGEMVKIKVMRDGKAIELEAKLDRRGGQTGRVDQNQMGSELSEKRTGFPTYFQHDTVIKPKDCGGPICDLEGQVLGINIARAGRVESYSIPTEALMPIMADLKSGKLAPKSPETQKKLLELKAAVQKAEEEMAASDKKLKEAQELLKKQEADKVAAEKKVKEAQEALEKAAKDKK